MTAVLELVDITAGYGRATVLREVSLAVEPGSVVAVLGANGAGKTTLLKTATGLLRPTGGHVLLGGADVTRRPAHERARRGLCSIPEGRGVFRNLTIRDNLRMALPPWRDDIDLDEAVSTAVTAFPALRERLGAPAGRLSGGQQQMLALCRAHLAQPAVLLVDEVSMGLAPKAVTEIFASLARLVEQGVALLLVEQYAQRALELADRVVLLQHGRVAFSGSPSELDEGAVVRSYLGVGTR